MQELGNVEENKFGVASNGRRSAKKKMLRKPVQPISNRYTRTVFRDDAITHDPWGMLDEIILPRKEHG
jgi:hypothetical protein